MSTEKTLNWSTATEAQRSAWVAEYVMGYEWRRFWVIIGKHKEWVKSLLNPNSYLGKEHLDAAEETDRLASSAYSSIRPYSTDITAAMEVVEKLRGEGFNVSIDTFGRNNGEWNVVISNGKNGRSSRVFGPLPLSVSVAALTAKGYKLV